MYSAIQDLSIFKSSQCNTKAPFITFKNIVISESDVVLESIEENKDQIN